MKIIYLAAGLLALALGAVGVVLPILPSTPFLLLAAFCFARSSQRLNTWFKSTKLYKNNLESFVRGQGMTRAAKMKIIVSVTVIMAIAFYFMRGTSIGRICLAAVWIAHIIALCFVVKTCPPQLVSDTAAMDPSGFYESSDRVKKRTGGVLPRQGSNLSETENMEEYSDDDR